MVGGFYYTIDVAMDENTIFQGPQVPSQPQSTVPAQNPAGSTPSIPMQPITPVTPPRPISTAQPRMPSPAPSTPPVSSVSPPPPTSPPTPGGAAGPAAPVTTSFPPPPPPIVSSAPSTGAKASGFGVPLGGILKAVIGLILLLVVGFLIFGVVVPGFFSTKNEKVTLTYWGLWEDPRVIQKVIDDFQKENKNLTVKYEKQDIKDQYRDRLLTRIANGSGPDIFQFHNSWLWGMKDVLTAFPTDVITPGEFKKAYFPVVVNDVTQNGAIYGVPLQMDTLALFTNTDMLEASSLTPPTNWEDFGKAARTLTVKDENGKIKTAGAALGTYYNITHAPDIISLLFLQNGANIYDLSATAQQSTDTLNYYTQDYALGDSNVWDTTLDPSLLAFTKGNLAMYFGYSWDIFAISAMNPQLHFQVSPVPHLPLGRKVTIASYWVEGVSQKSKHQKEAMLFMKFLTRKETLEKLFNEASKTRAFGELYPRQDLVETLKDNKLLYPFVAQAANAASSFFVSDTYDNGLNEKANGYLGTAVRSMLESTSAETALESLSAGVSAALKKYGQQ